jgi:hypothetical protein
MKEIASEYYKSLIIAVSHAASRSRTTYYVTILTCCFVLIGIFNEEYTWESHINFEERPMFGFSNNILPTDTNITKFINNKIPYASLPEESKEVYKNHLQTMSGIYAQEFFKRFELQIPVLGIRVFSSDLSLIASIALIVLFTWLYFCIRRESHLIKQIRFEFERTDSLEVRNLIFHGAIFENIFITATKDKIDETKVKNKVVRLILRLIVLNIFSPRIVMLILRVLPLLTIVFVIYSDLTGTDPNVMEKYGREIKMRVAMSAIAVTYLTILAVRMFLIDKGIE